MNDEGLFPLPPADQADWPDQPRLLVSYAYARRLTPEWFDEHLTGTDIIIDSGAFTVYTSGKEVRRRPTDKTAPSTKKTRPDKTIEQPVYIDWLLERAKHIRFAFSLDVIGDPEASMANYLDARAQAGDQVTIVPTWHFTEPESLFEEYCRLTDYVGIGGAVPFASSPRHLARVCRHLHEVAKERGVRLHGLGITTSSIIMYLPWTSVDSASWISFGLFGRISLANQHGRVLSHATGEPIDPSFANLCSQYGLDPSRMHEEGYGLAAKGWDGVLECRDLRGSIIQAGARAFMYHEAVKRRRHPHFRLYLSSGVGRHDWVTDQIIEAHKLGTPYPQEIVAR